MGATAEADACRLAKEGRNGRGGKPSSQKSPWYAVVGSRSGVFTPISAHLIQSYYNLFATLGLNYFLIRVVGREIEFSLFNLHSLFMELVCYHNKLSASHISLSDHKFPLSTTFG